MKCIYCNNTTDLTDSDIIPFALTGAKVHKKFVCHTHNGFTNDHYERTSIKHFDIFRNLLGLTERDGKTVRFQADLVIDGYTSKNVLISDKASIVGNAKRKYPAIDETGQKVLIGEMNDLLKISGASPEKIQQLNLANIDAVVRSDIRDLFISPEMLHTVAKIAYEWHCYINDIDSYLEKKYHDIVSYILSPDSQRSPVELVTSSFAWSLMDTTSRAGSHMLFEYQDVDGFTYVVYGFWNVLLYKVKVCEADTAPSELANCHNVYLYHVDGTSEVSIFGCVGPMKISATNPAVGLTMLANTIKARMDTLGGRDLSLAYLKKSMNKIKALLPLYEKGNYSIEKLLDYEADDRVIPVYIMELILNNISEYNPEESFNSNMIRILKTNDRYVINEATKKEALLRYLSMDKDGIFAKLLSDSITFLDAL